MNEYDKPFLTYTQQVYKAMSEYKLNVKDIEFAKKIIAKTSYYDLINGYKPIFFSKEKGQYKNYVDLESLYIFHLFDKDFQSIVFKYSIYVEKAFKNQLANYIAEHFSVDEKEYLKTKYYNPKIKMKNNKTLIIKTRNNLEKVYLKNSLDYPTKHYKENKNHIPPWILFKNATFSDTVNLYRCLKNKDKTAFSQIFLGKQVEDKYKKTFLYNSLTIVRKFRNAIAHNLDFIKYKTGYRIEYNRLDNKLNDNMLKDSNKLKNNNLYSMIISLLILLNTSDFLSSLMLLELSSTIKRYESGFINFDDKYIPEFYKASGIPSDFIDRIDLYIENTSQSSILNK